jgi:TBC1 domain family protein 5
VQTVISGRLSQSGTIIESFPNFILFFQLKQFALSGELQRSNLRAVCWKVFLGCLPENQNEWINSSAKSRELYTNARKEHMVDPHSAADTSVDLTVHNPLSLEEESPWNQFFQDSDLRQTIQQDIIRTHPDQLFFKQDHIQSSMLDLLFCYAKEHPDIGYRQGMHELLAPILFVLHAESRDDLETDSSINPQLKVVMDPKYIDHDAYALFVELMEGMQHFFMSASLEADIHKAKEQRNGQNMKMDPRTRLPFASDEAFVPSSAIGRKLDKIHNVLLKQIDDQLYYRLQDLGIPPQTYGIRWIRLLFGREFHLPSVLQLWDALFVEGNSLSLVDYVFVTMLLQIRNTLLVDDYSTCMQLLMKYPPIYEVSDLIQKALHLRNPVTYPEDVTYVREWTQIPDESLLTLTSHPLQIQEESEVIKKPNSFKFPKLSIPTKPLNLSTKLTLTKHKSKHQEPAASAPVIESPLNNESKDVHEMINNPKSRPRATSELDRLKEHIDNSDAKCLYCGRKMEAILEDLQDQVEDMNLTEEKETPVYLAIAGLKQVRDLLLHKLPFSGELPDYDEFTTAPLDKYEFMNEKEDNSSAVPDSIQ